MQTNLALDTYLESTARWSALTDPKHYSNDDVQQLVPTPQLPRPLSCGLGHNSNPLACDSGPESRAEINQRVDQQLAVILARTTATPNRSTSALKAWKTRRANAMEVNRQGTNIGKHHA